MGRRKKSISLRIIGWAGAAGRLIARSPRAGNPRIGIALCIIGPGTGRIF
jgi:hypothetical protein